MGPMGRSLSWWGKLCRLVMDCGSLGSSFLRCAGLGQGCCIFGPILWPLGVCSVALFGFGFGGQVQGKGFGVWEATIIGK